MIVFAPLFYVVNVSLVPKTKQSKLLKKTPIIN
jgi:hypothetical protein